MKLQRDCELAATGRTGHYYQSTSHFCSTGRSPALPASLHLLLLLPHAPLMRLINRFLAGVTGRARLMICEGLMQ